MQLRSIQQIADTSELNFEAIYYRAKKLGIRGKKISRAIRYTEEEIQKILNFETNKKPTHQRNSRKKITYLEFYFKQGNAANVYRTLNASRFYVEMAIKEWEETGCVTVESKMNEIPAKNKYKNVHLREKTYYYTFKASKEKYFQGGFKTEEEAFEALCKLKEELRIGR